MHLAIQCNRSGRLSSPQDATAPTTCTSSYASYDSHVTILPQPPRVITASALRENDFCCLIPPDVENERKRSSTASSDSESAASKPAYTISAILDFPKSHPTSLSATTDDNPR